MSLFLVACESSPSEQFTPQLAVHGLVRVGYPAVQANINRTYAIDEPFDTMFSDASGVVWRGGDTWTLVNSAGDFYSTRVLRPGPTPGDTLGIRIAKDGYDTVYGRTIVPDSFSILFPRNGDTVTMSDSMVWTRSRNCAGYYMSFRDDDPRDTFTYDLAFPNDTSGDNFDSTVFRLQQMVFLYLFKQGFHNHKLRVYALDTNYYDWVRAGGFGFGPGAPETTRLSGGLGVFGSLVGESVGVYVKKDTAQVKRNERRQRSDIRMQKSEDQTRNCADGERGLAHGPTGAVKAQSEAGKPETRKSNDG